MTTRARWITAAILLVLAAGAALFWLPRWFDAFELSSTLAGSIKQQIGRDVRLGSVSFSPLKGISVGNISVSEHPNFRAGEFLGAQKAVFKVRFLPLLKRTIVIEEIRLIGPRMKLAADAAGIWNFQDIPLLSQDDTGSAAVRWDVRKVVLEEGSLKVSDPGRKLSVRLEDAGVRLTHHSRSSGRNFSVEGEGLFSGGTGKNAVSGEWSVETGINFGDSGLSSFFGSVVLRDMDSFDLKIARTALKWKIFGCDRRIMERKFDVAVTGSGWTVSGGSDGPAREWMLTPLKALFGIKGMRLPDAKDMGFDRVSAGFSMKNGIIAVPLRVSGPVFSLDADLGLDGPGGEIDMNLRAGFGKRTMVLSAKGPVGEPDIRPGMSYTMRKRLNPLFRGLEELLLRYFPKADL